ncbi:hypothetical protein [Streptomyces sp. NPDC053069]|uniref:hypothetical protein n=1 Tax=Streptomyces sp. NPDC053069 TaxID=3365695 RepID=UPI0037CD7C69
MTAVDERGVAEFFEGFEPPDGLKAELLRGEGRANYRAQYIEKFGRPLMLDVLGVELKTSEFGTFPDVRPHRYP